MPARQEEPERESRLGFRIPDYINFALIALVLLYVLWRSIKHSFRLETGSISAQARDLLWFAIVCGLLAFATIECVKRLTYLRAFYHRKETKLWLQTRLDRVRPAPKAATQSGAATDDNPAFDALLAAMGVAPDDERRVFNLPSEQLAAQISAAADLALTPEDERYAYFVASVTRDERDLLSKETEKEDVRELRRAQQVRIGLDQLQVTLRDRWRRYLWGAGLWISGAYGIGLAFAGDRETVEGPRHVLAALVLGGVVAAVARDITAIVERLRG